MNAAVLIERLEKAAPALRAAALAVTPEQARWKPPSGAWSILEIVNHLLDEETRDFRGRLESTLRDPAAPWGRNDPEGWAREGKYNQRDLAESVEKFAAARRESIRWLRSLTNPDWNKTYMHPLGPVKAGDLLASWAAHDALHLRQIAKRLYELAAADAPEYSTKYAGDWGP